MEKLTIARIFIIVFIVISTYIFSENRLENYYFGIVAMFLIVLLVSSIYKIPKLENVLSFVVGFSLALPYLFLEETLAGFYIYLPLSLFFLSLFVSATLLVKIVFQRKINSPIKSTEDKIMKLTAWFVSGIFLGLFVIVLLHL